MTGAENFAAPARKFLPSLAASCRVKSMWGGENEKGPAMKRSLDSEGREWLSV